MVRKSMEVGLKDDGKPHVSYEPRMGADFRPVDVVIPALQKLRLSLQDLERPDLALKGVSDEGEFQRAVQFELRQCCGAAACDGSVHLAVGDMIGQPTLRIVTGATINCSVNYCPLIEPPESGDSEPRVPAPQPPALEAEVDIPLHQ